MEKIIFNVKSINDNKNCITINFNENKNPIEAANFLINELKKWNGQALNNLISINIT